MSQQDRGSERNAAGTPLWRGEGAACPGGSRRVRWGRALGTVFAAALLLMFSPGAWAQTGFWFDEFGASYKSTAMGQAFTAVADDYSAAYYNPAGLTQIKGIFENAIGYIYAKPRLRATFPGNSSINIRGQPSSRGMFTGIASSLDIEETIRVFPWFKRFALGVVNWTNLPEIIQYHAGPNQSRPHFLRHDMRFQLLALAVSLGFEVTPWFSIGAGIIPSIDSVADQHNFAATNKRDDPVLGMRLSIHQTAKVFVVPVFGILLKPPFLGLQDKVSFGVSYRGENKNHHGKGPLYQVIGEESAQGDPLSGFFYPPALTINLVSFAPRQVTFGLGLRPITGLTLAYDLTWKEWSRYQNYLELTPDPAFQDTLTHRVGAEYVWRFERKNSGIFKFLRSVAFRGGYYFEPTPVQNDVIGIDNIFDSDQDVYSAGFNVTFAGKTMEHDFEFFYQFHQFHDVSRMAYIDGVYATLNDIPLRDTYIPVEIGGNAWAVGGAYTMRF